MVRCGRYDDDRHRVGSKCLRAANRLSSIVMITSFHRPKSPLRSFRRSLLTSAGSLLEKPLLAVAFRAAGKHR